MLVCHWEATQTWGGVTLHSPLRSWLANTFLAHRSSTVDRLWSRLFQCHDLRRSIHRELWSRESFSCLRYQARTPGSTPVSALLHRVLMSSPFSHHSQSQRMDPSCQTSRHLCPNARLSQWSSTLHLSHPDWRTEHNSSSHGLLLTDSERPYLARLVFPNRKSREVAQRLSHRTFLEYLPQGSLLLAILRHCSRFVRFSFADSLPCFLREYFVSLFAS